MNDWEKAVNEYLHVFEYHFLSDFDRWLRTAFATIPIGGDEHVIHNFHLAVGQRLSSILFRHSADNFSSGQAHGAEDCKTFLHDHVQKLADLPTIHFTDGKDFTPQDAIKVLKERAIILAGDVESSITSAIKEILLKHLTGIPRPQTEKAVSDLLQSNMNRASLIVTTETTYAYNRGRLISYQDYGADYVQFRAVMDGRTCQICASRNGLIAPISEIGGNTPPVHGRCRCVLSPVFGELQSGLLTPKALDWSTIAPLPKGWVA